MNLFIRILKGISPTLFFRNTKTLRYAFSFVVLASLTIALASTVSGTRSYVELVKEDSDSSDTQTIGVYAVAHAPVNAVAVVIEIPSGFEVISIDRGRSVLTLWTKDPEFRDGKVFLEGGTYRRGFIGRHPLVDLQVRMKNQGQGTLAVETASFLAGDGSGTVIPTALRPHGELVVTAGGDTAVTTQAESLPKISAVDVNGDGTVSLPDVSIFMTEWVKQSNRYDFNNDGRTTIRDFSILLSALPRS